ncbi:MAG: TRAP transporter small permease [Aminobacteriaceae bacterium]|jgi:TRAP-type C4-dicarboxylate transport system permease small subunit|uniref:TRAP transporter small permease n=1 Tax=Aminivibrio sp. TaxID=1872489 RepID=UPI001A4A1D4F|nr:TRAP transporter small permease [Aminivibrio sp.]MBL3538160.1 TRAP transporter small permease [Aminivibrio sp.]MDK2959272.1 TRAP-type transport system small permease protein [Synergistaceae bacterium]
MKKILALMEKTFAFLTMAGIGLMLIIIFLQVISRYFFGYTASYSEELSRYLFVWVTFLSLPVVSRQGGHMAVGLLTERFTGEKLRRLKITGCLCSMAFLAIMVRQGIRMVQIAVWQTSPAMEIPMSYMYISIPLGCGAMLLIVIEELLDLVLRRETA